MKLEYTIQNTDPYQTVKGLAENFEFLENFPISKAAIIKPINVMGDISGAVIVLSDTITDVEKSLAEFGGMFMGRYLEG